MRYVSTLVAGLVGMAWFAGSSTLNAQSFGDGNQQIVDEKAILRYVNDTEIPAQSDGLITSIAIEEGKPIAAGQTLVALDTRLAEAELKVAQKEFQAATEKAKNTSNFDFNKASYALAKKTSEIHRGLFEKGATSRAEYDKILLEEEKARLAGIVSEIEIITNKLSAEVSEAKVGAANVQVELRLVRAPFDGVLAERLKKPNDYVRVGEKIVRLVGMDRIYVIGRVATRDPIALEDAPATAIISSLKGMSGPSNELRIPGKISFVSPVQGDDGKYRVKMEIANIQENGKWVLRDGNVATLVIHGSNQTTGLPGVNRR